MKRIFTGAALAVWASLLAAQTSASKNAESNKRPPASAPPVSDVEPGAKVVHYSERDVIKVNTKVRYTTLLILPKNEQILDFACGDKGFWIVNGNQNFAYVKPAKTGTMTDLNLVTASGNIYTFSLSEISEVAGAQPDLKIFVEPKEESMITASQAAPRFVPSTEIDNYRRQVELAKEEVRHAEQTAQAAADTEIAHYLSSVRFAYRFALDKKPFNVRAIYHDGKFTYIQARPDETPTVYEVKDGQANLINFEYRNGLYVVDKVIDRGYLAIGKQRLLFIRVRND
jgi:type IV secretory pathway VirB9-like protein